MTTRRRMFVALGLWGAVVGAWFAYQRSSGTGTVEVAQRFVDGARGNWWAIVAYGVVAAVRPVVLFPATLLTVAAGVLFGAAGGIAVAAVGANGSALIAYHLGRVLRRPPSGDRGDSWFGNWLQRLQTNGFEAVLVMRLLFLPYDAVSYLCGLVRVPAHRFLAANAIGTLPGTVAFVLIGASVERLDEGLGGIDRTTFAVSVVLVVASIGLSRLLARHGATDRA